MATNDRSEIRRLQLALEAVSRDLDAIEWQRYFSLHEATRDWRAVLPGWRWLHGAATPVLNAGARMIWLLSAIAIVTIVMAGRAHSKRLDQLDDLHAQGFSTSLGTALIAAASSRPS
jgi:hypothetical protein